MRNFFLIIVLLSSSKLAVSQTVQQPVIGQFGVQTSVMVPDRGGVFLGGVKRAGDSRFDSIFAPIGSSAGRFTEHTGMSSHVFISDLHEMDALILEAADRPDGLEYLRRIHSGVAFDNLVDFRGGAVSEVSPLAGRFPGNSEYRTRIPHRDVSTPASRTRSAIGSGSRYQYGAQASPLNRFEGSSLASSSAARQAQSDDFLDSLSRSLDEPVRQAAPVQVANSVAAKNAAQVTASRATAANLSDGPSKLDAGRSYLLGRKAERAGQSNLAILHYRAAFLLGSTVAETRLKELNDVAVAKK